MTEFMAKLSVLIGCYSACRMLGISNPTNGVICRLVNERRTHRPSRSRLRVAIALLVSFVGWTTTASADTGPPSKAFCSAKTQALSGTTEQSLSVNGVSRSFRLHVPSRHGAASSRMPVVFVLHGGWGTGKTIQKQSKMHEIADRNGFIAVFPDGKHRSWNAGKCCGKAMKKSVDDVGFINALIDHLDASMCIDKRRVYATGFSNGSMLSHRLACELSSRIAAIAPVSGVLMVNQCRPKRLVPVLVIHGMDDPRSLWQGGLGDKDPKHGIRPSVPSTMEKLYVRGECSVESEVFYDNGDAQCTRRMECGSNVEMALCRIENHGHQWPGGFEIKKIFGRRINLGPMSRDLPASDIIWSFFARHALPE